MLHLHRHISASLIAFSNTSIAEKSNLKFIAGFPSLNVNELLALKRNRRNGTFGPVAAVDEDSEFEVDPEQAREALRKLDEQLKSLSRKQVSPPKIRAVNLNQQNQPLFKEEAPELSGSFLAYLATALFVFTIAYNILFITVIKPSIDGPEPSISSNIEDNQVGDSQPSLIIPEIPVIP